VNHPRFQPRSRKAWRDWLAQHHGTSTGIWLVYAKKGSGLPSLRYADAVEEALCFGWIDSLVHPIDDRLYQQVFTPRKLTSGWSALNKSRVARLIAEGQMTPAGMALVRVAKKTGTWTALDHAESLTVPPELRRAIAGHPAARKHWPGVPPGARKQFLYWLGDAKRPETRARRIAKIVALVATRTTPSRAYAARKAEKAIASPRPAPRGRAGAR
jgi:uncharacterized protein YdeI (YjbR/CyaY-like superfamily)